jgi:gamma-glutamyl hydrolase
MTGERREEGYDRTTLALFVLVFIIPTACNFCFLRRYCASRNHFFASSLDDWAITSTSTGYAGFEFVATVEHKTYPFFGLQFHPEKPIFEWNRAHKDVHSEEALIANRYFFDTLVFYSKRNNNAFETSKAENRSLIYNYAPVIGGDEFFQQVYVF